MARCRNLLRILPALAGTLALAAAAGAPTAGELVAKARAYLGSEATLDAIRSIHYVGTRETDDGAKSAIEIIFQKPYQQRLTITGPKVIEITGLDNYAGWRRLQEVGNQSRWQLTLLSKEQIKTFRANAFENLHFFKGVEQRGGRIEVVGPETVDGREAIKVAFIHEPRIVFYRYFENATGRLLLTETEQGGRIREEGEMVVEGLRFPRRIIFQYQARDQKGETVEHKDIITFEKIILNEKFPAALFEVPALVPPGSSNPPES